MSGGSLLSGLYAGLLHPWTVPAHMIALVGLALVVGQQQRRRPTVAAFVAGLIGGLAALAAAAGETRAATVLLAAASVAGIAAAIGAPLPSVLAAPLALVVGICIGLDSPPLAATIQGANASLLGTALSALVLLGLIAAIAARLRSECARIGARILGSWIAASAIMVLALQWVR